ncbi:uncharacterized protein LOC105698178 isoform X2 [Orussus abietinus]|uniref:uncharacterized protein LOC105698178 isoform X2 n=1 Tax=Orussus abietinus TaxID=222816 RepID=UPI000626D725|nr:uncharacterized protein LOC105698178 isoform X2 [Orussus abietinus]
MVVDTGTVRLMIFLGMFLAFAGDYSAIVASIFGSPAGKNETGRAAGPEGPPKEGLHAERMALAAANKHLEEENAATRRAKMVATIKTACLPKLVCELMSSAHQDQLSDMERSLLNLIRTWRLVVKEISRSSAESPRKSVVRKLDPEAT